MNLRWAMESAEKRFPCDDLYTEVRGAFLEETPALCGHAMTDIYQSHIFSRALDRCTKRALSLRSMTRKDEKTPTRWPVRLAGEPESEEGDSAKTVGATTSNQTLSSCRHGDSCRRGVAENTMKHGATLCAMATQDNDHLQT